MGIVPPMSWAFERDVFDFTYDPAKARQLLDAAGYPDPDGDGPLPRFHLSLRTSTTEVYRVQAAAIQQNLARVGIAVLRENPLRTLLSTLGVVIGVASLVAVLALGDGMRQAAREEIERTTGVQIVILEPRTSELVDGQLEPRFDYPIFGRSDARDARREIAGVRAVALVADGRASVEAPATGKRRRAAVRATLAGLAGFMNLARFSTTTIGGHDTDNLQAIAAVVIGGTSLFGGIGTVLGSVFGVFIPAVLQNGFVIVGVEPFWQQVAVGAVLIGAVYLDQLRRRSQRQR